MAYQFVREPLMAEEADALASACCDAQEKLVVWPLLDCGLRISELCSLGRGNIAWQQGALRIKGKGGPFGTKSKQRVVPFSLRTERLLSHRPTSCSKARQDSCQSGKPLEAGHAAHSPAHVCNPISTKRGLARSPAKNTWPRPFGNDCHLPQPDRCSCRRGISTEMVSGIIRNFRRDSQLRRGVLRLGAEPSLV